MSSRKLYIIVLLLCAGLHGNGQVTPVTDQYILNPLLINPANTGGRGAMNVAAFYRKQWSGITGAPETITLTGDTPFSDGKAGIGFTLLHDKFGVTSETSLNASYSYRVTAGDGNLAFGLRAGFLSTSTRWSDLVALDPGDESFLADSKSYIVPDISYGMFWANEKYFAGFSIPRLIGYDFNSDRNRYSLKINPGNYFYLFNAGMNTGLTKDINFMPSVLLSVSPGEKMLLDLNAYFNFSDKFWAGTSFRSNGSIFSTLQVNINNLFKVAYSYGVDFSRLNRFSNGSHEIMLRYEFVKKVDVVNPLIF
jgi:type IX secretion system PorP/SprF family membrane protein